MKARNSAAVSVVLAWKCGGKQLAFSPQNLQLRQDKVNWTQWRSPRSCGVHQLWKQRGCFFDSQWLWPDTSTPVPTGHICGWGLPLPVSPRAGICFSKSQVCLSILGSSMWPRVWCEGAGMATLGRAGATPLLWRVCRGGRARLGAFTLEVPQGWTVTLTVLKRILLQ